MADVVNINKLTRDQKIARDIGLGVRQCDLVRNYGVDRSVVKRLEKLHRCKGAIKVPDDRKNLPPPLPIAVEKPTAAPTVKPKSAPAMHGRSYMQIFGGLVALLMGSAFGVVSAIVNFTFYYHFGRRPLDCLMLGVVGVLIDTGTGFLPMYASWMKEQHRRGLFVFCWVAWCVCVLMSVGAQFDFSAGNIGDTILGQKKEIASVAQFTKDLQALITERDAIPTDLPAVVERKIQDERTRIPPIHLKSSNECTNTTSYSAAPCFVMKRLIEDKALAER